MSSTETAHSGLPPALLIGTMPVDGLRLNMSHSHDRGVESFDIWESLSGDQSVIQWSPRIDTHTATQSQEGVAVALVEYLGMVAGSATTVAAHHAAYWVSGMADLNVSALRTLTLGLYAIQRNLLGNMPRGLQAIPNSVLALIPDEHDRIQVERVLVQNSSLVTAILSATEFAREVAPAANATLVSDAEDEWDLPLTLYIEIPGDYDEFVRVRSILRRWWAETFPNERHHILLAPRPGE
jgi:hypothetical protein